MKNSRVIFNKHGLLPKGDYKYTFKELQSSIFVKGPEKPSIPNWDSQRRANLVHQAEILVKQLWDIGITKIWLDGSFAEAKPHPNDIDGYFECNLSEFASGYIQRELNKIDLIKSGRGIHRPVRAIAVMSRNSFPCGINTGWSYIPTMVKNSGITDIHGNLKCFRLHFVKIEQPTKKKA